MLKFKFYHVCGTFRKHDSARERLAEGSANVIPLGNRLAEGSANVILLGNRLAEGSANVILLGNKLAEGSANMIPLGNRLAEGSANMPIFGFLLHSNPFEVKLRCRLLSFAFSLAF